MKSSLLNTPVALIFFARPETFKMVFDMVKIVRPRQLFLIQDGPRANHPEDAAKIEACRTIAENIDWECEVIKNYAKTNMGCGLRPSSGISWVFEHTDRVIILEDDCIPNPSFFYFCEELLERYKDDERICMISGLNHFGQYECGGADYFFAKTGAIWGWATWKRVWDMYDYNIKAAQKDCALELLKKDIRHKAAARRIIKNIFNTCNERAQNKRLSYWDTQWEFVKYSQSMLSIVPARNLISNVGVGDGATHSAKSIKLLNKKIAQFFFLKTYSVDLPLKVPPSVICCHSYDKRYYSIEYPNPFVKALRKLIFYIKRVFYRQYRS